MKLFWKPNLEVLEINLYIMALEKFICKEAQTLELLFKTLDTVDLIVGVPIFCCQWT